MISYGSQGPEVLGGGFFLTLFYRGGSLNKETTIDFLMEPIGHPMVNFPTEPISHPMVNFPIEPISLPMVNCPIEPINHLMVNFPIEPKGLPMAIVNYS